MPEMPPASARTARQGQDSGHMLKMRHTVWKANLIICREVRLIPKNQALRRCSAFRSESQERRWCTERAELRYETYYIQILRRRIIAAERNNMLEFKFDTQLLIEGRNLSEDEIFDYITKNI